jgi:hypothetical protein
MAGAAVLLLGVPVAFLANELTGKGASEILHLALGVSFLLLAVAAFDFALPGMITLLSAVSIGTLGVIFLLQAVSELTHSASLGGVAYGVLGQSLERVLGYAFLLWCGAVVLWDSQGATRLLGGFVLTIAVGAEIYGTAAGFRGGEASPALKLLTLPLFVWLFVEGLKTPRQTASG